MSAGPLPATDRCRDFGRGATPIAPGVSASPIPAARALRGNGRKA